MLDRLAGNAALKQDLAAALAADRLAHSILLVGETGCGAGFAARCLAADYLYPAGGPHAEAVLRGEDSECISLRGGRVPPGRLRWSASGMPGRRSPTPPWRRTPAAGCCLSTAPQNMNQSSANALLKIIEEPPEGVLFLFTATSAAGGAAHHPQPLCRLHHRAGAPGGVCRRAAPAAARPDPGRRRGPGLSLRGTHRPGLAALRRPETRDALALAREFVGLVNRRDTYLALARLTKLEKDKPAAMALLEQLAFLGSAGAAPPRLRGPGRRARRRPAGGGGPCPGRPARQRQPAPDAGGVCRPVLPLTAARILPSHRRKQHESHIRQIQGKRPRLLL